MKKAASVSVAIVLAVLSSAAQAQWAVIDAGNLAQNVLIAARTMEQINNQVLQLQNEAQMLVNDGRQLTSLDFNALSQLRATLATTDRLLAEAQGLAFNVSQLDTDYARLYPDAYGAGTSTRQMADDAHARWQNALDALHTSMRLQAQVVQNLPADEATLADLVNRSQSAVGQLQATQATNQLLALQAKQTIDAQQLRITQDRAAAAELARQAAAQARALEVRRRFLGDGTPYTPQAIAFY
ncbi:P-type conjugative transfer protein TrbJ [Solimonas terrae]|uniref:P-type conjugative transfer protein TrbJ n=1 Tax=Solimonas terrae TaxID=1396819 RepID=A0A6M2BTW3_9GAMM|nr:P-type conjugative transfer protein TrbJ [Solimonas terrae]NGY05908.1 P-type conjugative transfer protein TrbJ [Solimonas terrae]